MGVVHKPDSSHTSRTPLLSSSQSLAAAALSTAHGAAFDACPPGWTTLHHRCIHVDLTSPPSSLAAACLAPDERMATLASPLSPDDISTVYADQGLDPSDLFLLGIHTDMRGACPCCHAPAALHLHFTPPPPDQ